MMGMNWFILIWFHYRSREKRNQMHKRTLQSYQEEAPEEEAPKKG
jgi:hypothetical protein